MILILAVIQAKMDSTRLPGKVMLPLLGKPVIWHIYERLKFSKELNNICISTSTSTSDDPIVNFAIDNGIKYHRGSEKNLVSRHLGAARSLNADAVVRITADCPFVDPEIVDKLIILYNKNPSVDFISNTKVRTYPIGLDVEVFPKTTLEKLLPISDNPVFYEYFISMYVYEHPGTFNSIGLQLDKPNLLRWTLDYPEDYDFIKQVYTHLYKQGTIFYMKDILKLLKEKPDLEKINSMHISQYSHLKYQKEKDNIKN